MTVSMPARWPRPGPAGLLAVAGLAVGIVIEIAGGEIGPPPGASPPHWLGLLGHAPSGSWRPGLAMAVGIVALVALWLKGIELLASGVVAFRQAPGIALAWAAPFAIGPPVLSSDIFSYAAQGRLATQNLSPSTHGVAQLGPDSSFLAAVDPAWRAVHSPYGPLATLIARVCASVGGSDVGTVVMLKVVAFVSVAAIVVCAVALADPTRRPVVFALVALNPLVLLQLVSAGHLEAPMLALALGAVLAERRGHVSAALVLGCAAASVKFPAVVLPAAMIAIGLLQLRGDAAVAMVKLLAKDLLIVLTSFAITALFVPDGWAWLRALNTPGLGHTPAAPANLVAMALDSVLSFASHDDLEAGGQLACAGIGLCLLAYLLMTAGNRRLLETAGFGLFALCLVGPVLYPWYLLWGLLLLAPIAIGWRFQALVLLSVIGATMDVQGFTPGLVAAVGAAVDVAALGLCAGAARRWRAMPLIAPGQPTRLRLGMSSP